MDGDLPVIEAIMEMDIEEDNIDEKVDDENE